MSKKKKEEYSINHTTQLYSRFMNLALNRFSWEGLPSDLPSWKLEEMLIKHGKVMFYKNSDGVLLCLPCTEHGNFDYYNQPLKYNVIGHNVNEIKDRDDGVVIRNNALATNDIDDLMLFAERINEVEQTMDINLFQQNTPYMVMCDETERLTWKNIIKQVKEFKFVIFGRKSFKSSITENIVLNTKADYLLDKLQQHKTELMNELLTFLGINNNNVNKKERLVVDEVNSNNDFILVNIDHMFDERKRACEEINKMFNLNVKVEKREVELNGTIHNGIEGDN